MVSGIDFLSSRRKGGLKQAKIARLVNTASIVVLISYCLATAGAFSYWLYLQRQNQTVESEINLQKQKISQLQEIESWQLLLKQRLSLIDKLFSRPKIDHRRVFDFLDQIIPAGVRVTDIELAEADEINVVGIADNAVILSVFLEELTSQDVSTGPFSEVTLFSTSRSIEGFYDFINGDV